MSDLLILAKRGSYFGLLDPQKPPASFNITEFAIEVRKKIYKMLQPQDKKALRLTNHMLQYDLDENVDIQFQGIYFKKVEGQPGRIKSINFTQEGILPSRLWEEVVLKNSLKISEITWEGIVKGDLPFTPGSPRVMFKHLENLIIDTGLAAKSKASLPDTYLPYITLWRNQLVLLETIKAPHLENVKLNLLSLTREGQDNDNLLHKAIIKFLTHSGHAKEVTIDFTLISRDESPQKFPPPFPELTYSPLEKTPRYSDLRIKSLKLSLRQKLPWSNLLREIYWFQFIEKLEQLTLLDLWVSQELPWHLYEDILRHKCDTLVNLRLKGVFPQDFSFKCIQRLNKIKVIEIEHQKSSRGPFPIINDFGLSEPMKGNLEILKFRNFLFPSLDKVKALLDCKQLKELAIQIQISSDIVTCDPFGSYVPELVKNFGEVFSIRTLETFDIELVNRDKVEEKLLEDWETFVEQFQMSLGM